VGYPYTTYFISVLGLFLYSAQVHSPGRMVGHSSWQVQHHLAKQMILIENPLDVKVGQKNDLSIAPIINFKYLQMYCLSERSSNC